MKPYFGGPDLDQGLLRDLLERSIDAVPSGGWIRWGCYYFRDIRLAKALIRAAERGVDVLCVLEARPRMAGANLDVIDILHGLSNQSSGLRLTAYPFIPAPGGKVWKPQFHEKIFCFSHPEPFALVGSFNPSSNGTVDPLSLMKDIGDQDQADNMLVDIKDTDLVNALKTHLEQLPTSFFRQHRRSRSFNFEHTQLYFWPRTGKHPVVRWLSQASPRAKVKICASHLRNKILVKLIRTLSARGIDAEVIVDSNKRRLPGRIEDHLRSENIKITKPNLNTDLAPMHMKFILLEDDGEHSVAFGSFNWTLPSFYLNNEIALIVRDKPLFEMFENRWMQLKVRA